MTQDIRFDTKLYTLDFSKVESVTPGKGMQNVIINLGNGQKIIVGINRRRNPHKLYVLTPNEDLRWNPRG